MTMRINFRLVAQADVEETAEHLEQSDPRLAFRFRKAVREAAELAARFPELGRLITTKRSGLFGSRYLILRSFRNHVLYDKPTGEEIIVLRVLRGARDIENLE